MTMPRRLAFAATAVLLVGGLILVARCAADGATLGDLAVIESYTWMAAKGDLLLGPYSRFQWHHPGPISFFWMAPFYLLSAHRAAGMSAGVLVLNLASLAVTISILIRRAGRYLAVAMATSIAVFAWRIAPVLTSFWNPHVPVFGFIALIVAAADTVSGAPMTLPVVAAFASLVGQTHIALLPSALVIGAVSLLAVVRGRAREQFAAPTRRSLLSAVVVLIVLWALPAIEQFSARPGNITQIWTFFVSEPHHGQRFANALYAWEDMLTGLVRPGFAAARGLKFRQRSIPWVETVAIVELLGLAVAVATAFRARRKFEAALASLLLLTSLIALWSATRIEDTIFDHEVFWMSGIGALNIALLAASAVRALPERLLPSLTPRASAAICWALVAVCAAAGAREMRSVVTNSSNMTSESEGASAVAAELRDYFARQQIVRPLIRIDQDGWPLAAGVIVRLQKDGVPVAVEDDWIAMFTPAFAATGRESVELAILGKPEHVRRLGKPGDTVVIDHDPLLFVHRLTRP